MKEANNENGTELLDSVILKMREESVPPVPKALVDPLRSTAKQRSGWIPCLLGRPLRGLVLAAAVLLALGLGLTFIRSPQLLAQVQSVIRDADNVSFNLETRQNGSVTQRHRIQYAPQHGVRAQSASKLHIFNLSESMILEVDHISKSAMARPVYDAEATKRVLAGSIGVLGSIQPIEQVDMKRYSTKGREALEFWARWDSSIAHVSVDPETNRPFRIEVDRGHDRDGNKIFEIVTNIRFGDDASRQDYSLQVPDGYAYEKIDRTELSEAAKNYILSDNGLGPVEWGMSFDEVVALIGRPDSFEATPTMAPEMKDGKPVIVPGKGFHMVPAEPFHKTIQMHYDSQGFRVFVSEIAGVVSIQCYDGAIGRRFPGRTSEGIEIGMTREKVLLVLGVPSIQDGRFQFRDDRLNVMGASAGMQQQK